MRVAVHHNREVIRGDPYLTMIVLWNAYYSLFIFIIAAWAQYNDLLTNRPGHELSDLQRAWYIAALALFTLTEPIRLFLGVRGNRVLSVSYLVGFWLLTLCAHMPIMGLLNVNIPFGNSLDYSTSTIELIFGSFELVLGFLVIRRLGETNTVEFFVKLGSLDQDRQLLGSRENSDSDSDADGTRGGSDSRILSS